MRAGGHHSNFRSVACTGNYRPQSCARASGGCPYPFQLQNAFQFESTGKWSFPRPIPSPAQVRLQGNYPIADDHAHSLERRSANASLRGQLSKVQAFATLTTANYSQTLLDSLHYIPSRSNVIKFISAPEHAGLTKKYPKKACCSTKKTMEGIFNFTFVIELRLLLFSNTSLWGIHEHVRTQVETF